MSMDTASPLRIALFHDLPSGGAKRTAFAQVKELTRRGHSVHAFLPSTAEEVFQPLSEVAHEVTVVEMPAQPDREQLLRGRPTPTELLGWIRLFLGLRKTAREIAGRVDAGGFDVLLVHPSQFTQAPHLLRYTRTPTLYYSHEVLRAAHEPLLTSGPVRLGIRLTLGRTDKKNACAATAIAANSNFTRQRMKEVYGRDSVPIPPGIDADFFHPLEQGRESYVLSVGALHPLKGMDFVVEAVGRIPPETRPPLVIVADRSRARERERIQESARRHGVELELRFRIDEVKLREAYNRAQVVLCAAHREPFGLVPLEAMACGTPVIAIAEGGFLETVEDDRTGFLVPREIERFAKRLDWLLSHTEERDRMGRECRSRVVSHWTWERSVDHLVGLIRTLKEK